MLASVSRMSWNEGNEVVPISPHTQIVDSSSLLIDWFSYPSIEWRIGG